MKEAKNNAIDLLLRSLARGERDDARSGEVSASGEEMGLEHLDADELNLYAEGVLAPPARARYTEHLADCRQCRNIVTSLAQSAGFGVTSEEIKTSGVSFWRSLGALFSMPVLRYAIPVLLLTGMISIGLIAFRDRTTSDFVAVNQQAEPAAPVVETNANSQPVPINASSPAEPQRSDAGGVPVVPSSTPAGSTGLLKPQLNDSADKGRTEGAALKDLPASIAGAAPAQPVYAPEVYPAPPPKVVDESETRSGLQKEKQEYLEREAASRNQDEVKMAAKDDSPRHGPARSRTMSGGSRRDEDVTENLAGLKNKKADADESDTLTVSGRNFRRRGNVWVDTAYSSSRSVINVSRGSEQFRSLMADEPGLRAIVQQLGGEVIVVWKNRAYRIR